METIEEIREEARKILTSPKEINDKIDSFLSIVIGEEVIDCPECYQGYIWKSGFPDYQTKCEKCEGIAFIKHPITIRDANERRIRR